MARSVNLEELVKFTRTETDLVLSIPKTTKPCKEFGLKEVGKSKDGTAIYEVPKSDVYAYFVVELQDGSVLTCNRYKRVSNERRQELYDAAKASGLNVKPLELRPDKTKPAAITVESLKAAGFKPASKNGKHDTVANSL